MAKSITSHIDVREGLLKDPWKDDDGLLREFLFHNETSFDRDMQV